MFRVKKVSKVIVCFVVLSLAILSSTVVNGGSENGFNNLSSTKIDYKYIEDVIKELTSEKYQGRLVGTKGNELVVRYVVDQYKEIGLYNPQGLEDYKQEYKHKSFIKTCNLIGFIPGSDEGEYIIISAHLDHLGKTYNGKYYPGALDNASGIAGMLSLAKILNNQEKKPRKTIVFIAFNGEEKGHTGSRYYVKNPVFPLENTVAINLDMVGSKKDIPLYIITYNNKNTGFRDNFCKLAKKTGIKYSAHISNGSDYASFAIKNVPAVGFTHYDAQTHHSLEDGFENVNIHRLGDVIKLLLTYLDKNAY